jgi:2-keto-4-pentenoate hydratase
MIDVNKIVNDLYGAYQTKVAISTNPMLDSYETAYLIQKNMANKLGKRIGWKIGLDGKGNYVRAPMFQRTLYQDNALAPRAIFNHCLVESELAIVFKDSMPNNSYTIDQINTNVESINAGIEICDSRLQGWPSCDPTWQLADNLTHGGYVLGGGVNSSNQKLSIELLNRGDFAIAIASGNNPPRYSLQKSREHPFKEISKIFLWLVSDLVLKNDKINAGDIITTGSFSGSTPIEKGETASVTFKDIGTATVTFI